MRQEKNNTQINDQYGNSTKPLLQDVTLVKSDFKLTGLGRKKSMTCEPLNNQNIFWPKVGLTQDRFNALWDYFKGNKPMQMIAEIEHEGLYEDGTPINGNVVGVRDL